MPINRGVNGIVETNPVVPVFARAPAIRAADRKDPSKGQERRAKDHAARAAQPAYQEQAHQAQAPKPAVLAQDLMTMPVTCLPSDSTLLEAWNVMKQRGIHHLPVTSVHDTLVGMISDQDLLPFVHELESLNRPGPAAHYRLTRVLNSRVLSATPTTEIRDIALVMLDEHVRAIPLLDSSRHAVGILTTSDILRAIVRRSPLELWT